MRKTTMSSLGIEVSNLGFGCMRFPTTEDGKIDRLQAEAMLDEAMANGVTYYDTAYPYHNGESEIVVGEILNKYERSSYYLATKLPIWSVEKQEDVRKYLEEQLAKLQKDYIDFYLIHAMNRERMETVKKCNVLDELVKLREEGKIRYIGFSFHDEYAVFEEIINLFDWDFCQIQYNYMDTDEQAGDKGVRLAEEKGIPMVIMEPVRGGSLAKFSEDIESIFKTARPDKSIASWAFRWVAGHSNCKVILSGMSTPEQLRDNLNTFTDYEPLTDQDEKVVERVVSTLRARVQNGCTGCRYCMPCPSGVGIPDIFKVWNSYHIYQSYDPVKFIWESIPDSAKPDQCVECGACEEQCPQKIRIREQLKLAKVDLDQKKWQ